MTRRCPYCGHDHDKWMLDLFSGAGGAAMGYWMTTAELAEAIPPAYTEHIGAMLLDHLKERAA